MNGSGHFFAASRDALQVLADLLRRLGNCIGLRRRFFRVGGNLLTAGREFRTGACDVLRRFSNRMDDLVETLLHLIQCETGGADFVFASDLHIVDRKILVRDLVHHGQHAGQRTSD